jgi:hypothetical protein
MPTFSEAFDRFKKDGFFELDTKLYTEQINKLQICARFLREDNPEIPFYQFHLSHVQFVPGYLPRPERVVDGVVVEHHAQRDWHPAVPDVVLLQMARSASAFNMGLRFNELNAVEIPSEEQLKSALYSLLNQAGIWSSIKIDWVSFFCDNEARNYLNADFHNDLLDRLTEQAGTSLKELSLKPFSLSNSLTALVNFLTRSADLEILHLEIIDATRDEWLELARVLAVCPKLKSLNLGNTVFDENAYAALSTLLDENYRIKRINVAGPIGNRTLMKAYNQLNQRLSKPRRARFKEERLSQEVLLELAFQTLIEREKIQLEQLGYMIGDGQENKQTLLMKRINFLLSDQGARKLTDSEKEAWLEEARVLPDVYTNHREYMKNYSALVHLYLDELVVERGKTVGYLLIEKVLETRNVEAMEVLLEAKVDLFEMPDNTEKPFLKKALQGRRYGAIGTVLLHYMAQDMSLTELALEYFRAHPELHPTFEKFTEHLCKYANILIHKNDLPGFLSFTKDIINLCRKMFNIDPPSEKRGEEYADIQLKLRKSMRVATANGQEELSRKSVSEMRKIVQEMRDDSFIAARGFLNKAKLHDPMFIFLGELDGMLSDISDKIDDRKDDFIEEQDNIIAEQSNALKENETIIKNLLKSAVDMQAKLDRMEAHIEMLNNLLRQNGMMNQNPIPEERPEIRAHHFARR